MWNYGFWGKFQHEKNSTFWFFLEFGAIIEFVGCRKSEYRGSPRLTSVIFERVGATHSTANRVRPACPLF